MMCFFLSLLILANFDKLFLLLQLSLYQLLTCILLLTLTLWVQSVPELFRPAQQVQHPPESLRIALSKPTFSLLLEIIEELQIHV